MSLKLLSVCAEGDAGKPHYGLSRQAASVGWILERTLNVETPVDTIVNAFARHALWIAITLFLVSFAFRFLRAVRAQCAE